MEKFKIVSDTHLAAFLIASGHRLAEPARYQDGRITFKFQRSPEVEKVCSDFYDRNAQVDALSVLETLRTLRAMITELKREGGGR